MHDQAGPIIPPSLSNSLVAGAKSPSARMSHITMGAYFAWQLGLLASLRLPRTQSLPAAASACLSVSSSAPPYPCSAAAQLLACLSFSGPTVSSAAPAGACLCCHCLACCCWWGCWCSSARAASNAAAAALLPAAVGCSSCHPCLTCCCCCAGVKPELTAAGLAVRGWPGGEGSHTAASRGWGPKGEDAGRGGCAGARTGPFFALAGGL